MLLLALKLYIFNIPQVHLSLSSSVTVLHIEIVPLEGTYRFFFIFTTKTNSTEHKWNLITYFDSVANILHENSRKSTLELS